jgi:hypothetical protein
MAVAEGGIAPHMAVAEGGKGLIDVNTGKYFFSS